MKVGYSYWGFLGDYKLDKLGNELSTPDGNAFYSWSIIREFQNRGIQVKALMPDRDAPGYAKYGRDLFCAWCRDERAKAYEKLEKVNYAENVNNLSLVGTLLSELNDLDLILLEWRFLIPGRNDGENPVQPDYMIQDAILKIAKTKHIPVIVFDLDYKLTVDDIVKYDITSIVELGNKWTGKYCKRVEIPFAFDFINTFPVNDECDCRLVYVGNRYERDYSVSKYIERYKKAIVYGNWNESGRDSSKEWPTIDFRPRITQREMHKAYSNGDGTVLLAKDDYYGFGFMTARLIESIFYGVVPFFPEEFGNKVIRKYAGIYADFLKVTGNISLLYKMDSMRTTKFKLAGEASKSTIVNYLRRYLKFMDAKYFVNNILELKERIENDVVSENV